MFENFLKGTKQSSVVARLEVVEIFNSLIQERAEVRGKVDTLSRGLELADARLTEIPREEQNIRDDHYRAHVKRELDPNLPDRTDLTNQELKSLADERGDLQGKVVAYREALASLTRTLGKLDGQYGQVEQAKRNMWASITDELVKQVPPNFAVQFSRIWTALDRSRDYCHAPDVLALLAPTELTNETKMATIDALSHEYGFTNE